MLTSSPSFRAGTVVVVPFPYSDRLAEKRRPAVVISGEAVGRAGVVWIAMITSARNDPLADDWPIHDLAATGLVVPSVVRPVKIACIEPSRILRAIGALPAAATDDLCTRLRALTGPSHP
jgi:mRNA interferase MazF